MFDIIRVFTLKYISLDMNFWSVHFDDFQILDALNTNLVDIFCMRVFNLYCDETKNVQV